MSNSWLCTRSKLLQIVQIRSLSHTSWFENRGNTLSLDLGGNTASFQDDGTLLKTNLSHSSVTAGSLEHSFLQTLEGSCRKPAAFNTMSKYDILTFLRPMGVRNQDLIKSLAKIVEPLECNDTIHVGIPIKNHIQPVKTCKKANTHAFNSFDAFSPIDEPLKKDFNHCMSMSSSNAAVKTKEKNWHANTSGSPSDGKRPNKDDDRKGPTIEQLEDVKEYYVRVLIRCFKLFHGYGLSVLCLSLAWVPGFHKRGELLLEGFHHKDIVFENNFFKKPKVTQGLSKYSWELTKIRVMGFFIYPSYFLEIQSIIVHPNNGYVKMHWRAYMMNNYRFVRYLIPWVKGLLKGDGGKTRHNTIDAISTFHVNKDGKIYLHKVDRRIPIEQKEVNSVKNLAAKTVEMVGLAPKSNCKSTSKEIL